MIYDHQSSWCPQLKTKKNKYMLLNVALLQYMDILTMKAEELKVSTVQLRHRLENIILNIHDLHTKFDGIIIPTDSFSRLYQIGETVNIGMNQKKLQKPPTIYKYFIKKNRLMHIGIHIKWDQLNEFQNYFSLGLLQNIKIYSFYLDCADKNCYELHLPQLRKIIHQIYSPQSKKQFHIIIKNSSSTNLIKIRQQFINGRYPIEWITISTDILALLIKQQPYNIIRNAYLYNRMLNRYIPLGIGCIFQQYYSQCYSCTELQEEIDVYYSTLSEINKQNYLQNQRFKANFNSGLMVPSILLHYLLVNINASYNDFQILSKMEVIGISQLSEVSIGHYQKVQEQEKLKAYFID